MKMRDSPWRPVPRVTVQVQVAVRRRSSPYPYRCFPRGHSLASAVLPAWRQESHSGNGQGGRFQSSRPSASE